MHLAVMCCAPLNQSYRTSIAKVAGWTPARATTQNLYKHWRLRDQAIAIRVIRFRRCETFVILIACGLKDAAAAVDDEVLPGHVGAGVGA